MPSKIFSAAIIGLDAQIIEVETDVNYGLHSFTIVGLADKAVEESKERVEAAIKSIGFSPPHKQPLRVLVNLAPADLKKEGSFYDLPIALGFLAASKQLKADFGNRIFIGELALDGKLRPVKGVLAIASAIKEKGWGEIVLPKSNAQEASLIENINVVGVDSLKEAVDFLEGRLVVPKIKTGVKDFFNELKFPVELSWIKGQEHAKRALEISAAGSHHLMMVGPPGAGKSLLAKSIPSLLPPLTFEEALEVTKIYSIAGLLPREKPLMVQRPFRAPHHTSSEPALIGGGNPLQPGEITLSHRGILFLDEFPEFHRDVLEALRQPMEEGQITILRSKARLTFPARFTLVAASNPCPCGYYGDNEKECKCHPLQVQNYRRKLSGPLMDRMDLFIEVPRLKYEKLTAADVEGSTQEAKTAILKAREIQKERYRAEDFFINSEIGIPQLKKYCHVDGQSENLLRKYVDSARLSARGYHRVLKLSRTIADLEGSENILYDHVAEALMYRIKED